MWMKGEGEEGEMKEEYQCLWDWKGEGLEWESTRIMKVWYDGEVETEIEKVGKESEKKKKNRKCAESERIEDIFLGFSFRCGES